MLNVRKVIVDAFKMIGEIGEAESLDGTRTAIGENLLNEIVSQYNLKNLFAFTYQTIKFTPSFISDEYSIGIPSVDFPDVDINADRPANILRAYVKNTNSKSTDIELNQVSIQDLPLFESEGISLPSYFSYVSNYPIGKIKLNTSLAANYDIILCYSTPIPQLKVNDKALIPPEYEPALKYTLAHLVAKRYGKPIQVIADMKELMLNAVAAIEQNTMNKTPDALHLQNSLMGKNQNILNMGI